MPAPGRPRMDDSVRKASLHRNGPWPKVSVWHGGAMRPSSHPTPLKSSSNGPTCMACQPSRPRGNGRWLSAPGLGQRCRNELIESYTIPSMAHGTPLATRAADDQCGTRWAISSRSRDFVFYHIARFFGLAAARRSRAMPGVMEEKSRPRPSVPEPFEGEVLEPDFRPRAKHLPMDIGAVITRALKTAGLTKGG